ncbi:DNA helicase [Pilimelia anulata]|uniref:DNA 3'-5' helicase n=1 Tax=Pilimelia anulata TaxID=53371 RepID=A0A8J3B4T7_9ACTN|nr:3'-5' exonuclease [Pilimelia anulata]GGJ94398.1 DNA helicase [Pilimelia anulata]
MPDRSADAQAQQLKLLGDEQLRWATAVHEQARRFAAGAAGERTVDGLLRSLVHSAPDWRLLADRRLTRGGTANIDFLLVGPGGVFVVDAKQWRYAPRLVNGRLHAGTQDRQECVERSTAAAGLVEQALAELGLPPISVHVLLAFVGHDADDRVGRVRVLGHRQLLRAVVGAQPPRLGAVQVRWVYEHLRDTFGPHHRQADLTATGADAAGPAVGELFDAAELARAGVRARLADALPQWMTFLHSSQAGLVTAQWTGPARISGPAGTGKTVIGLHRAVHIANRSALPVLFLTFQANLPRVAAESIARLAPAVAARVECLTLHGWALRLLRKRGRPVRLPNGEPNWFPLAWSRAGRTSVLAELEPDHRYWRDEISHVIKGRGITDYDEYRQAPRTGRRLPLRPAHREAVWELYLAYERFRTERGGHDYEDVLSLALAEVRRGLPEPGYAAVIADEVQDLTLTGVRILTTLTNHRAAGLLLLGDSRQQVYPGGWRLSDAGLNIRGARARVLDFNYRNSSAILELANQVLAGLSFEDHDGTTIHQHAATTALDGGHASRHTAATVGEHDRALLRAVAELAERYGKGAVGEAAVICAQHRHVAHYAHLLAAAGHRTLGLRDYNGNATDRIKIGTARQAKGLDFKYVLLPRHDDAIQQAARGGAGDVDRLDQAKRLLYVAMTRPRDYLWIGRVGPPEQPTASPTAPANPPPDAAN